MKHPSKFFQKSNARGAAVKNVRSDSRSHRGDSRNNIRGDRDQRRPMSEAPAIPKNWRGIIGHHAILEALSTQPKASIEMLWLRQGWEASQELKELHNEHKAKIQKIEIKQQSAFDRFGSHQGAALFVSHTPQLDWAALAQKKESKIVLLDGIEDPHNLGAILRSSWLMGVDAILIPGDRATGLTPVVHKVACGGAEHVPVEACSNFSKAIEDLKQMGYWVFGLSHEGKGSIFDLKIPEKVVWCVGSEDKGLRKTTEKLCDELVRIPQVSAAASYNASVAAGMALSESFRQQNSSKKSSH